MNEFLNPKSMLTPGAAGALMMLIANSVCRAFPEFEFRYVALALSFVIGLLVFKAIAIGIGEKAFYWLINSLIIFATGVGASNIGANLESSKRAEQTSLDFVSRLLISEARAEDGPNSAPGASGAQEAQRSQELEQKVQKLKRENEALQRALEKQSEASPPQPAATAQQSKATDGFFRRW